MAILVKEMHLMVSRFNQNAKAKLILSAQIHQTVKQIVRDVQCHWTSQSKGDKERLFRINRRTPVIEFRHVWRNFELLAILSIFPFV